MRLLSSSSRGAELLLLFVSLLLIMAITASAATDTDTFTTTSSARHSRSLQQETSINVAATENNEDDEPDASSSSSNNNNNRMYATEFDKFNQAIETVRLVMDDPEPLRTTLLFEFYMAISNLYCTDIQLSSLSGASQQVNASTVEYDLAVEQYSLNCYANYEYSYGFLFRSAGTAQLIMPANALQLRFGMSAPDEFAKRSLPNTAAVTQCQPVVEVQDFTVSGQIDQLIVQLFQNFLITTLETAVSTAVCTEITNSFVFLQDTLTGLNAELDPYLQKWNTNTNSTDDDEDDEQLFFTDPLAPERDYFAPSTDGLSDTAAAQTTKSTQDELVSLGQGTFGGLLSELLDQADEWLGKTANDDSDADDDLAINVFLRENVLDENGHLVMDLTSIDQPAGIILFDSHDDLFEIQVAIRNIQLAGLDSLQTFNAIDQLGNYTVGNAFGWDWIDVVVELQITAGVSQLPSSQFEVLGEQPVRAVERVSLSLRLHDLDLAGALFVAFPQAAADNWPIGHLLQPSSAGANHVMDCLLQAVDQMAISQLHLSLQDMTEAAMRGLGSAGFDAWFTSLVQAAMIMYRPTLLHILPAAVEDLRVSFNEWLKQPNNRNTASLLSGLEHGNTNNLLQTTTTIPTETEEVCPAPTATSPGAIVDFRDLLLPADTAFDYGGKGTEPYGSLMASVWNLVTTELQRINENTGKAAINEWLIAPLTQQQSGTAGLLVLEGDLINESQRLDIIGASFHLRVYDAFLKNLDSFGSAVTLLDPVPNQAHVLNNAFTAGVNNEPLQIGAKLEFGLAAAGENIVNSVDIVMTVQDLDLGLLVLLRMMEESIMKFPLKDIDQLDCWLATLPVPTLNDQGVRSHDSDTPYEILDVTNAFDALKFDIQCIDCSSPEIQDLADLLSTDKGIEDAAKATDEILELVVDIFGSDYMQLLLDRRLVNARARCPHRPEYDPNAAEREYAPFEPHTTQDSIELLLALGLVAVVMMVSVAVVLVVVRILVRRRHRRWLDTICERRMRRLLKAQQLTKERTAEIDLQTTSLFKSQDIPWFVRMVIPVIIMGNVALFISGHLSPAASVSIFMAFAGNTIEQHDFYEFSIVSGTVNIWKGGGKELAILILAASGAWPYAKQIISFVCWFLPPSLLPSAARGSVYRWLDALAKWSMIDVFTIIVSLVGFRVSAQSPDVSFLPDDFYSLDLLVIPKLGLYANFIAQVVSQISSHFIIHYHDKVVRVAKKRQSAAHNMARQQTRVTDANPSEDSRYSEQAVEQEPVASQEVEESLSQHSYARPHRGENERLIARSLTTPFLVFLGVVQVLLIVLGCALPSFSLELLGIVAVFVEAGQRFSEAVVDFSLFYMMKMLVNQADFTNKAADYIGLGLFAALFLVTVMLVPIIQAVLLLYHWLCPMTRTRRKRVIIVNEMLQAWQYTEVFALAILAGTWQLGSISDFMVNVYCEQIAELRAFFGLLNYMGILDKEDSQCFRVRASIESAFYCLAVGALILAFLNTFVKRAASQYLRDKELQDDSVTLSTKEDGPLDVARAKAEIAPPPQLFTDRFRWFLVGSSMPLESYLQVFSTSSLERTDEKGRAVAVETLHDALDDTAANQSLSPSSSSDDADEVPAMPTEDDTIVDEDIYTDHRPQTDGSMPTSEDGAAVAVAANSLVLAEQDDVYLVHSDPVANTVDSTAFDTNNPASSAEDLDDAHTFCLSDDRSGSLLDQEQVTNLAHSNPVPNTDDFAAPDAQTPAQAIDDIIDSDDTHIFRTSSDDGSRGFADQDPRNYPV